MNNNFDVINGGALQVALLPVNLAAAASNAVYANMSQVKRLGMLLFAAAGTSAEPIVISLTQATSSAGAGAKACNLAYIKVLEAADITASQAWVTVSTVDRQNPAASYTATQATATNPIAIYVEVDQCDLDLANGFTHVRLNIADTGSGARLGSVVYLSQEKFYQGEPTPSLLS